MKKLILNISACIIASTTLLNASEGFQPIDFNPECEATKNDMGTTYNHFDHIEPELRQLVKGLVKQNESSKSNVLFFGCGNGRLPIDIYNQNEGNINVFMNDMSPLNLATAYSKCQGKDGVFFDIGNALEFNKRLPIYKNWPSLNNSFDAITSFSLMHFLEPIHAVQHLDNVYENLGVGKRAFFIFQVQDLIFYKAPVCPLNSMFMQLERTSAMPQMQSFILQQMLSKPEIVSTLACYMRYTVAQYNSKNGIAFPSYNPISVTNILKEVSIFDKRSINTAKAERAENCIPAQTFKQMAQDLGFDVIKQESFMVDINNNRSSTCEYQPPRGIKPPFAGFILEKRKDSEAVHKVGVAKWVTTANNHKSDLVKIHTGKKVVATYDFPYFKVLNAQK